MRLVGDVSFLLKSIGHAGTGSSFWHLRYSNVTYENVVEFFFSDQEVTLPPPVVASTPPLELPQSCDVEEDEDRFI
jgi:hypothetical protein